MKFTEKAATQGEVRSPQRPSLPTRTNMASTSSSLLQNSTVYNTVGQNLLMKKASIQENDFRDGKLPVNPLVTQQINQIQRSVLLRVEDVNIFKSLMDRKQRRLKAQLQVIQSLLNDIESKEHQRVIKENQILARLNHTKFEEKPQRKSLIKLGRKMFRAFSKAIIDSVVREKEDGGKQVPAIEASPGLSNLNPQKDKPLMLIGGGSAGDKGAKNSHFNLSEVHLNEIMGQKSLNRVEVINANKNAGIFTQNAKLLEAAFKEKSLDVGFVLGLCVGNARDVFFCEFRRLVKALNQHLSETGQLLPGKKRTYHFILLNERSIKLNLKMDSKEEKIVRILFDRNKDVEEERRRYLDEYQEKNRWKAIAEESDVSEEEESERLPQLHKSSRSKYEEARNDLSSRGVGAKQIRQEAEAQIVASRHTIPRKAIKFYDGSSTSCKTFKGEPPKRKILLEPIRPHSSSQSKGRGPLRGQTSHSLVLNISRVSSQNAIAHESAYLGEAEEIKSTEEREDRIEEDEQQSEKEEEFAEDEHDSDRDEDGKITSSDDTLSSEEPLDMEEEESSSMARPMIAVEIRKSRRDESNLTEEWYHQANCPPLRMSASEAKQHQERIEQRMVQESIQRQQSRQLVAGNSQKESTCSNTSRNKTSLGLGGSPLLVAAKRQRNETATLESLSTFSNQKITNMAHQTQKAKPPRPPRPNPPQSAPPPILTPIKSNLEVYISSLSQQVLHEQAVPLLLVKKTKWSYTPLHNLVPPIKPVHIREITLGEVFRDELHLGQSKVRFLANVNFLYQVRYIQRAWRNKLQSRVRAVLVIQKFFRSQQYQMKIKQSRHLHKLYSRTLMSLWVRRWAMKLKIREILKRCKREEPSLIMKIESPKLTKVQALMKGYLVRKKWKKIKLILSQARQKRRNFIYKSERQLILSQGIKGFRKIVCQEANQIQTECYVSQETPLLESYQYYLRDSHEDHMSDFNWRLNKALRAEFNWRSWKQEYNQLGLRSWKNEQTGETLLEEPFSSTLKQLNSNFKQIAQLHSQALFITLNQISRNMQRALFEARLTSQKFIKISRLDLLP